MERGVRGSWRARKAMKGEACCVQFLGGSVCFSEEIRDIAAPGDDVVRTRVEDVSVARLNLAMSSRSSLTSTIDAMCASCWAA